MKVKIIESKYSDLWGIGLLDQSEKYEHPFYRVLLWRWNLCIYW